MTLDDLKVLTVSDTLRDQSTPLQLKNLEYLSLPVASLEDSVFVNQLQKALPNTHIVPNDGFCMGSGWLLLIIPAIFLGVIIRRRYLAQRAG